MCGEISGTARNPSITDTVNTGSHALRRLRQSRYPHPLRPLTVEHPRYLPRGAGTRTGAGIPDSRCNVTRSLQLRTDHKDRSEPPPRGAGKRITFGAQRSTASVLFCIGACVGVDTPSIKGGRRAIVPHPEPRR